MSASTLPGTVIQRPSTSNPPPVPKISPGPAAGTNQGTGAFPTPKARSLKPDASKFVSPPALPIYAPPAAGVPYYAPPPGAMPAYGAAPGQVAVATQLPPSRTYAPGKPVVVNQSGGSAPPIAFSPALNGWSGVLLMGAIISFFLPLTAGVFIRTGIPIVLSFVMFIGACIVIAQQRLSPGARARAGWTIALSLVAFGLDLYVNSRY